MVEKSITALSRIHGLFVITRNSSFTYKGRAAGRCKQVWGRELGVRYVLEGGFARPGMRLQNHGAADRPGVARPSTAGSITRFEPAARHCRRNSAGRERRVRARGPAAPHYNYLRGEESLE